MLRDFHQAQLNFLPSATKSTTMCGDATNWDEEVYRESILKEREIQTRTVFRTVWAPSLNPSQETVVVPPTPSPASSPSSLLMAEPTCYLQAHEGPDYDVKFYGNGEDSLLLSCGDDGRIQGWRWKDCEELYVPLHMQGKHVKPVLDLVNPQHKGPWGALSPIPEDNALAVNNEACRRDAFFLLLVILASVAGMWYVFVQGKRSSQDDFQGACRLRAFRRCSEFYQSDCKSGKCVQAYEPAKGIELKGFFSCVSCIALDASESWLACGSDQSLSVWNLPASECISRVSIHASIQDVVFDENQVLAVGAEPLLCRYDINGAILSQMQCVPQSAFSVSLHPSGVIAIGGYVVLWMLYRSLEVTCAHLAADVFKKGSLVLQF